MPSCNSCGSTSSGVNPPVVFTPPPIIPPKCEGSNPCVEITDAQCVVYNGTPLEPLHILPGQNLEYILSLLNKVLDEFGKGLVFLTGTNSIEVFGDGSLGDPFRSRLRVNTSIPNNLIRTSRDGVSVVIDEDEIARILRLIKTTPTLKALFCSICDTVAPPACLAVTGVGITSTALATQPATFVTTWTLPTGFTGTSLVMQARLKLQSVSSFTAINIIADPAALSTTDQGFTVNTIYQIRFESICSSNGTSSGVYSNVLEHAYVTAVGNTTKVSTNLNVLVSFTDLGADVDRYEIVLTGGTLTQPWVQNVLAPVTQGNLVSYNFTGLVAGQTYHVDVITYVGTFSRTSDKGTILVVAGGTTPAVCTAPTALTAVLS